MLAFREVFYVPKVPSQVTGILVADIGGTNCNFGLFEEIDGFRLLLSMHIKSREITDFPDVVYDVIGYIKQRYQITVDKISLAAAGVVSEMHDFSKPTNLDFVIDTKIIKQKTNITCVFVVNDFEVIGYGLQRIDPKNLVLINKGVSRLYANKIVLGAGTGLGKCILDWNKYAGRYIPLASEGGHADFAPQNQQELDLVLFIKEQEQRDCNISWEDVLSGDGIRRLYQFFCSHNGTRSLDTCLHSPAPDEIFKSRITDKYCQQTFQLYTKLYARCAKNFALDALALGGVYIAGGIAAKNLPLFELPEFIDEFFNCGKQQELLKQVPIYVITDYNVSLYGAAEYLRIEKMCE